MHRFQYKAYRRRFAKALTTAKEGFATREGIVVRIEDRDGRVGFGEAAPIPSFGTESFPSALAAAAGMGERVEFEETLPDLQDWPCLQWACGSALAMLEAEGRWPELEKPWPVCGLVSELGDVRAVEELAGMHYQCLKFKIGKTRIDEEFRVLERIVDVTEGKIRLRLDANGMLDSKTTRAWLERIAALPVEFLEQPLEVGHEEEMVRIARDFPTALALDESVGSVDDLKRWRDAQWAGLFVIKPSLSGDFQALDEELSVCARDCVFSSSLETQIGTSNALALAIRRGNRDRALGFGVERLFGDRNIGLEIGPFLQPGELGDSQEFERLWNLI